MQHVVSEENHNKRLSVYSVFGSSQEHRPCDYTTVPIDCRYCCEKSL